tara:strand:- start:6953 stop:8962 length:2010 start_codon:yes stop_codon:yes gene_type:complete
MHKKLLIILFFFNLLIGYSQDFRYGKVSKEELAETQHPLDADANAAILYHEERSKFEYDQELGFFLLSDVYERVKIYNKEGYDWATRFLGQYQGSGGAKEEVRGLKGVTYNLVDGKIKESKLRNDGIFDEERSKNVEVKKFTMPDVQDGSVFEFKYTLKTPFIGNINELRLQEKIPINKSSIRFATIEYLGYKMHQKGWLPIKIDEEINNRKLSFRYTRDFLDTRSAIGNTSTEELDLKETIYIIEVEDVPALKEEVYCGNVENYMSALKFELAYTKYPRQSVDYKSTTWEAVSKSIYESPNFGDELKIKSFFEDDIDALLANTSSTNEKMIKVFEFVKNKMAWNSYFGMYTDEGVRSAYKKGSGNSADINLMLVAMLRYAGIDANPVILSTKNHGIPIFPTREGFNYVIAGAEVNGTLTLMDATNKRGEVNLMEEELLNWNGRLIREDGTSKWVNLYPSKPAMQSTLLSVNIDDQLNAMGKANNKYEGHFALAQRIRFATADEDEMRLKLEENYTGVELYDVEADNLETLYKPVMLNYDFETESLEQIGGKVYFSPMFYLATLENPFTAEERTYPIDYVYTRKNRYIISIDIPEGYQIESLPESAAVSLSDDMGSFVYRISQVASKIQLSIELAINTPLIGPDYYQDIKKFYDIVIAKENEKVVLTKV